MRWIAMVALVALPILEIATFIQVGRRIGVGPTLALVILSALAGAALVRHQGLAIFGRVRRSLRDGRLPVAEAFDGACVVVGGSLLVAPGFITDVLGLLLLVPPVRTLVRRGLGRWLKRRVDRRIKAAPFGPSSEPDRGATVIEGEFTRLEEPRDAHADSGGRNKPLEDHGSPWRRPE